MSTTSGERITTPVAAEPGQAEIQATEPLTPSPSGDSSNASRTPALPMSPPRPQQNQGQAQGVSVPNTPSVPSSPAPPASADRSPAMTPPQQRSHVPVFASPATAETGVVLGLEQLERQQDEAERRRRQQMAQKAAQNSSSSSSNISTSTNRRPQQSISTPLQSTQVSIRYLDDDTAPSSTQESQTRDAASHTGDTSLGSGDDTASSNKESSKFGRIIKNTRKRLSSNDFLRRRSSGDLDDPAEEDEEGAVDALIYGHLQKLGRNGKWQTRWFECDGQCLSYYKSSKRSKLLATLELVKVGGIVVNEDDPKGCSFTIQVLGRPYYLRAESRAACKDWVITLNRVKEARMQQGNVKLVHPHKNILFRSPPDLLGDSAFTQGIAIDNPHRARTRAVDESTMENIEEIMLKGDVDPSDPELNPAYYEANDNESLSQVVLARWHKRKSSMSKMASKLSRWARSLKKYGCSDVELESNVRLDRHVHPPGHDNPVKTTKKVVEREVVPPAKDPALSGWIGKETSLAVKAGPVVIDPDEAVLEVIDPVVSDPVPNVASSGSAPAVPAVEDDEETRELS